MDPHDSPYQVGPSQTAAAAAPGFFVRLATLPFWPKLWRESPEYGWGAIVGPLLLWILFASVVAGVLAANVTKTVLLQVADYYEREADPLLLEDGKFRVVGERQLRYEDPDRSFVFLIDPENTVSDDELADTEHVVVRADRIRLRQRTQIREMAAEDLARLLGDPVLIDADYLRDVTERFVRPAVMSGYTAVAMFIHVFTCALYSLFVGLLLFLLRGQYLGLSYGACVTVALAVSAATVALDLVLGVAGVDIPLPGILVWPLLMFALGWIALMTRAPRTA
jgi:hypothetical protein